MTPSYTPVMMIVDDYQEEGEGGRFPHAPMTMVDIYVPGRAPPHGPMMMSNNDAMLMVMLGGDVNGPILAGPPKTNCFAGHLKKVA